MSLPHLASSSYRPSTSLAHGPIPPSSNPATAVEIFLTFHHSNLTTIVTSPSLSLTLLPTSFTFKDRCDSFRPTQKIQDNIHSLRSVD